jgi:hypothetical protein
MEYVMVPVPEEYVVDVMTYVARLVNQASRVPWTKEVIEDFFESLDETSKALISLVARYTVADKQVGYDQATQALELSEREIKGITREINERAQRNNCEPLMGAQEASVQLGNGRIAQRWLFVMTEPVARMIRAHERATLPGVASPETSSEVDSSVTSVE